MSRKSNKAQHQGSKNTLVFITTEHIVFLSFAPDIDQFRACRKVGSRVYISSDNHVELKLLNAF